MIVVLLKHQHNIVEMLLIIFFERMLSIMYND